MKLTAVGIISLLLILIVSCQNGHDIEFDRYFSAGKLVYQSHCENCHGKNGEGLQALMPPLADSIFLKKNLHKLSCIVKNGLNEKVTISKKNFDWQMPPSNLNFKEIAQVLTYVNNSFGNNLGVVTYDDVTADLGKCR